MKREKQKEAFDYETFEQEAISKLRSGKGLTGEGGALTGLISRIIGAAFEGEIEENLKESGAGNRRNGYTSKKLRTGLGEIHVNPPRDMKGEFSLKLSRNGNEV